MNINFFEPQDAPQPKENVKFERLEASVYPDRWRVKITIHVTPFLVRPNVAVVLMRNLPEGEPIQVVADLTILETMHAQMEFTLHIRYVPDPEGEYLLKARLYFEEGVQNPYDEQQIEIHIPAAAEIPDEAGENS